MQIDPIKLPDVKIHVLDSSVLVHDYEAPMKFEEHIVVIPPAAIGELDAMKTGNDSRGHAARSVIRFLRELRKKHGSLQKGVPLEGQGWLFVTSEYSSLRKLPVRRLPDVPDNRIIATAHWWQDRENHGLKRPVILVTKDAGMDLTADQCGLKVEDYTNDQVKDNAVLAYTGRRIISDVDLQVIDQLFGEDGLDVRELGLTEEPLPHTSFIITNGHQSGLGRLHNDGIIRRVTKHPISGITPRNAEQTLVLDLLCDPSVSLITISGNAGTGKTLMALAAAIEQRREYRQIFIARPIVPLSNKDLGFLPGDISQKLDPYLQPLFDNFNIIEGMGGGFSRKHDKASPKPRSQQGRDKSSDDHDSTHSPSLLESGKVVIASLPHIRGRSLNHIFFIVDEAQNLTPHEVKTIITRAGEGTKLVFTGDIHQIDHPHLDARSNGLSHIIERMRGQDFYGHTTLERGERSRMSTIASQLL